MVVKSILKLCAIFLVILTTFNCENTISQVNANSSPEAKALLDLYIRISGKYVLTGQHNYPNTKDRNSRYSTHYTGQTPVIWSSDFGFAKDGDTDSYLARPDIVKEAIRQHKKGSIITICWHAVPPTANEPVIFKSFDAVNSDSLKTIQGQLTDKQFKEVLTPGSKLYNKWAAQVDSIAHYLKLLQDANVPVLWRPYHEMNGDWFWWGGRVGENGTVALYKQLYDRLVNYHKLNNLVWVWNIDRPTKPFMKLSNFYPGENYFDIASLDVYGSDFNKDYYDSLLVLAKGKPILFGEVGNPPSNEILKNQPKWTSWVIWAGFTRNTSKKQYQELLNNPKILTMQKPAYFEVLAPYRKACGLPLLPIKSKYTVNFSGNRVFSEEKSDLGKSGMENISSEISIDQDDDLILVKKLTVSEWSDDKYHLEEIPLDGIEMKSLIFNSMRVSKAILDDAKKNLKISSTSSFVREGHNIELKSTQEWTLQKEGKELKIVQISNGFDGEENKITLVYQKK